MRFLSFLLALTPLTSALYAEDAGKLDFLVSTAGHGPPSRTVAALGETAVVTSDAASENPNKGEPTSCYIASRSVADGSLLWRRNVCSANEKRHAVAVGDSLVATVDAAGSVRAWSEEGALLWEKFIPAKGKLAVGIYTKENVDYVVASAGAGTSVWNARTAQEATVPGADKAFSKYSPSLEVNCEGVTFKVTQEQKVAVYNGDTLLTSTEQLVSAKDAAENLALLTCHAAGNGKAKATMVLTTARGSTLLLNFDSNKIETAWKAEEGLSQVSSAVVLDASHYIGDLDDESQAEQLLSLGNRLSSQWATLSSFITSPATSAGRRDHIFGFVKVAALLSSSSHRLYGIATTGTQRGDIQYTVDLPLDATWHRLVHGAPNAAKAAHGINGATHSREVLVLSSTDTNTLHWVCLDGSNGEVHKQGSQKLSAAVAQVIPTVLHITSLTTCRQGARLVLKDGSVVSVLPEDETLPASLYTHTVQPHAVESLRVAASSTAIIGTATFPGEEIVSVAYPPREEVIQSPCNVLGDDSLLLKYLNPHMAVFITRRVSKDNDWTATIQSAVTATKQKRKPTGVQPPAAEEPESTETPNLFVNVLDTVSGRILYRTSHIHAAEAPVPSAIFSENWIIYSYLNTKTRRAQVGVLSLYEGMINNKGLTAFASPEQSTSFSSLDARDTKPVVLSKVYSIAQPVTALGMTASRSGISSRRLLLATLDGHVRAVDRKVLDPRRPVGQVKEAEKKEGLRQYSELIPTVPFMSLSYNQTVEGVSAIISAPTDLESQSLVLAFGGPDIFFARTSPSRGFDLLPDNFNRLLLSMLVVGLLVALLVVQNMAKKKVTKQGWS